MSTWSWFVNPAARLVHTRSQPGPVMIASKRTPLARGRASVRRRIGLDEIYAAWERSEERIRDTYD